MSDKPKKESTTILITSEGMGNQGDVQLQMKLLKKYLHLMNMSETLPAAICFYTEGVKLAVEGSPVMDELKLLEEKGVWLIVCQTCLKTFNLVEKVKVGIVGGMTDIIEAQWRADKVITL